MLVDAHRDRHRQPIWESLAGDCPLSGYAGATVAARLEIVPAEHWNFLETGCHNYFETPEYIFVHGGLRSHLDPAQEDAEHLQWMTLASAEKHYSGRKVICGHSPQASGRIADLGHTIGVDTGIAQGGWLSCLALESGEFWQADAQGQCRSGKLHCYPK
jgi:serine/threonine protein phosphatase 1